jgi:hypothetical protein
MLGTQPVLSSRQVLQTQKNEERSILSERIEAIENGAAQMTGFTMEEFDDYSEKQTESGKKYTFSMEDMEAFADGKLNKEQFLARAK